MKKVLILLTILTISLTGFSQSKPGINLCGNPETKPDSTILTLDQFIACGELTANNKNLTVVSFAVGIVVEKDYRRIQVHRNKLSELAITSLKKYKPSIIYIEKIKLSSKKGTIQNAQLHTVIIKK